MNLKIIVFALSVVASACASAEYNLTPTGWLYDTQTTTTELSDNAANDFRATSIQFRDVSNGSPRFVTTWVKNTGSHYRNTHVVVNKSASQMLNDYGAELLLDFTRYTFNGQTRFAAIFAYEDKPWAFMYGKTMSEINSYANAYNLSVVDMDAYTVNDVPKYDAVFNVKDPARPTIITEVNGFGNVANIVNAGYNVIDIQPRISGKWPVVYQKRTPGDGVGYYSSTNFTNVLNAAGNNGCRLDRLQIQAIGNSTYYSAILVPNVNAIARRMVNYMLPDTDGNIGAYLKQVDGPVLADLQANRLFHPSSTIKALFSAHALITTPVANLNSRLINVWDNHTADVHVGETPTPTVMPDVIKPMMLVSDNQMANAMMDTFGKAGLTNAAGNYGMASTDIRNKMGTGGPYGNPNNFTTTTLTDMGRLYEGVATLSIMTSTRRATFYNWMVNQGVSNFLTTVANEEANALGLSTYRRQQWSARRTFAAKAGSNDQGGVNGYLSIAGSAKLPYWNGRTVTYKEFVYGAWINDAVTKNNVDIWATPGEILREQLRESLKSFETY